LLGHLLAVALLFLAPSRNEVSHDSKLICNQFLMLEFSILGIVALPLLASLSANGCRSRVGMLGGVLFDLCY
jgi:hypothetical protein